MHNPIEQLLRRCVTDLNDLHIPYALVGGLAYSARAEPRFTRDIDFTIAVSGELHAEQITSQLIQCGYLPQMEIANRHTGALATFRMRHKEPVGDIPLAETPFIDLLFAHCGIEQEVVRAATLAEPFPGLMVPTVTTPYLIAMKVLAESDRRLQDRIDLQNLLAVCTPEEKEAVPQLLTLIVERGHAFGKNLHAVYQSFVEQCEAPGQ